MSVTLIRIKEELEINSISKEKLASILGLSDYSIKQRLNGKVKFRVREIARISEETNVSTDYFFGRKDSKRIIRQIDIDLYNALKDLTKEELQLVMNKMKEFNNINYLNKLK